MAAAESPRKGTKQVMPGGRISEQMTVFARVWSMYVVCSCVTCVQCVLQLDAHAYASKVVPMHGVAGDQWEQWEDDAAGAVLGHRLGTICHVQLEGRRRACVRGRVHKKRLPTPLWIIGLGTDSNFGSRNTGGSVSLLFRGCGGGWRGGLGWWCGDLAGFVCNYSITSMSRTYVVPNICVSYYLLLPPRVENMDEKWK